MTLIVILIAIAILLILIYLWSATLVFYHEKEKALISDEKKVFSPDNRTIEKTQNSDKAIMFIHGFPTTPHMYKMAADYAYERGFDVYAPLIPTFGADYKEFSKTNFSSWFLFIDSYYRNLRSKYKRLYVVGVSMGGAMTLKLAEKHSDSPTKMDGIAVLSAPVVYNSLFRDGIITNFASYFGRIIKLFIPYIAPECVTSWPGQNDGGETWHGYRGTFTKQGVSLIYNLKSIRRDLFRIRVPMISIHDVTDKTVPFENQGIIKKETYTESLFIETNMPTTSINTHHSLLMYYSTYRTLMDDIIEFFRKTSI